MSRLSDDLKASPEVYAHSWDSQADAVMLIRLGEAELARASFLDQRILSPERPNQWLPRRELTQAVAEAGLGERLGFVFHIGHVGSTLLSRLLGAAPSTVLSVREPAPLRSLAITHADLATPESSVSPEAWDETLDGFLKLWSRTFRPGQTAVVKATSFASELAPGLLQRPSAPCAVLMYARPEAYVASILGGPNSRTEARALGQSRLRRLHRRLGETPWRLWSLSEGELIAMSWAAEMTALAAAQGAAAGRAEWLDFDAFLADPGPGLRAAFERFGPVPPEGELDAILAGPLMRQYSKAPEHAYDARLRGEVLAAGKAENPAEFSLAMAWLDRAGAAHPLVAEALAVGSR
jgi:hypothetical protein